MKKTLKKLKSVRPQILMTGLGVTLFMAGLFVFKPQAIQLLEYKLYDVFLEQVHSTETSGVPVIVDIDDQSLKRFGQWPWPRYRMALLLEKIRRAGALAVGLDILFAEPDRTSPRILKQELKRDLELDIGFSGLPQGLMDHDSLLAGILSQGPYVLGYSFSFHRPPGTDPANPDLPPLSAAVVSAPKAGPIKHFLFQAEDVVPPLPNLLQSSPGAGYMNTLADKDGVLRRTPLFIAYGDSIYPQLGLATLLQAFAGTIPDPVIKVTRGGVESLKIKNTIIPLQANGALLLNYRGPSNTFSYISAADILQDRSDPQQLQGKIVFIGTSASGLKDIRISPLDQIYPGVEAHATIVDNILSQDFISRPDWTPGLELSSILVFGLLTTILIGLSSPRFTLPVALLAGLGAWFGSLWSLDQLNIWISPSFPLITLIANFSMLNLLKFRLSEKDKRFFRSAFSKYVSKAVVDQLAESPDKLSLKGEEKEMSILFSDIRGFTSISEQLSPVQVTHLLNEYFTPVTRVITSNQGTLDKFIGDAVMAFWNAPLDVPGHRNLAIRSALDMLGAVRELNQSFQEQFGVQIKIGIGLHCGLCRVGNMGSSDLFDYTIIGDSVNLASRLEGLTKFYGVELIASEDTLQDPSEGVLVQDLDLVRVKGKQQPVRIFAVYGEDHTDTSPTRKELERYHQALQRYREQDFDLALQQFKELAEENSRRKIYTLYQSRCSLFCEEPPGADWDGVFIHESK